MDTILMSEKERRRLEVFSRVVAGEMTIVEAASLCGVSYRQGRRIARRLREGGSRALVHGLRGRAGNRGCEASVRPKALELYASRYSDFGPTLASEQMAARDGVAVHPETLRRWLIDAKLWRGRSRRQEIRQRRERRACRGELVQLDGSPHAWFESRGDRCVLMVMIDDATNETYARFFAAETTRSAMETFRGYAQRYGIPRAVYPDQHSIYRPPREPTTAEALAGKKPRSQFGRAMDDLGVKLILARSPQAKGRVERRNRVFQDRLIKAMRLDGISDIASANGYLDREFLPMLNARFTVPARGSSDVHVALKDALPPGTALDEALCVREQRTVSRDWCVQWRGRVMQIAGESQRSVRAGSRVMVREHLDGRVELVHRGRVLAWRPASSEPSEEASATTMAEPAALIEAKPARGSGSGQGSGARKPSATHPWRKRAIPAKDGSEKAGTPEASDSRGNGCSATLRSRSPASRKGTVLTR